MGLLSSGPSAINGTGLFAAGCIPSGRRLIEYVGERIDKGESLRRCEGNNEFIFSLSDEWDVDGDVNYNLARLINHSCDPNCEAILDNERLWIVSMRAIQAGEEVTFNYGYDLEDYREHPCRCGAKGCVGFIVAEEFFSHLQAMGHPGPKF